MVNLEQGEVAASHFFDVVSVGHGMPCVALQASDVQQAAFSPVGKQKQKSA